MLMFAKKVFFTCVLFLSSVLFPSLGYAATCEDLMALSLPDARVTSAERVSSGTINVLSFSGQQQSIENLPRFCRVEALLTPTRDSEIKIEVWLPEETWNGKYLAVGNGAWAGSISISAMVEPLRQGYVTSSTDTGHSNNEETFFGLNEEKLIDFAYRSVHEMAVQSKAIINAYYGNAPNSSIFSGCSTGGRQALTAVQRYPRDFNGVIAGAPAIRASHLQGAQLWAGTFPYREGSVGIPANKRALIHDAVMQACDVDDGVVDGVLESPQSCAFQPETLACAASEGAMCLSTEEVISLAQIYQGPLNSLTGEQLSSGYEMGSELGWQAVMGDEPLSLAVDLYKYLVFEDENWDFRDFDMNQDMQLAEQKVGSLMDAVDPDLSAFINNGGKLLMYHGWSDPGIPPGNTVNYYQSVMDTLGFSTATNSLRLFMVPGMGHCRGGEGPDSFDSLAVMDTWLQQDQAPNSILVSRTRNGKMDRTRALCPYPEVAVYDGTGSTDDVTNFSCQAL